MELADNFIILRRKLLTANKFHAAFQQTLTCEDVNTTFLIIISSAPYQVIEDEIENTDILCTKETFHKITIHKGIRFKNENFDHVISVENEHDSIENVKKQIVDHHDVSSSLLKLSKTESNNDKHELSIYYNILSEQLNLINLSYNERIYPKNSFTLACGL